MSIILVLIIWLYFNTNGENPFGTGLLSKEGLFDRFLDKKRFFLFFLNNTSLFFHTINISL